jgi:FAD/FMN-containing dehydrogenase
MTTTEFDVGSLRDAITGAVALPGDPAYDTAVDIWNGVIERRPGVVATCASPDDVALALAFARGAGLEISVRGGGHGYAGLALTDGGLMIDLSQMKAVLVDPYAQRAQCGGGVTWGELDAATQEHGLAVPGGFISTTGIAGLCLGGGFGWLSRLAGLTSDNLISADVVTADGSVLRASESENDELFWALRGGGGNFGVVTSFEFRLHRVGPLVHLGALFYAPEQGGDMFRFAREYVRTLPDECGVFLAGLSAPPEPFVPDEHKGQPVYLFAIVGLADEAAHSDLVAPVRTAVAPLFELVTPIPYVALQQMFNGSAPWGILGYEKAVYLDELTDGAIEVILEHQPNKQAPLSFLPIFVLGGEFARIPDDATAFGGTRSVRYMVNIAVGANEKDMYAADRDWARAYWSDLVAHAVGVGSYINFLTEYDESRVRSAYGPDKYTRLAELKGRYDPQNVFHLNANIPPAARQA